MRRESDRDTRRQLNEKKEDGKVECKKDRHEEMTEKNGKY